MKLPIPVNIITGGLGAGKTTAISHLLRCKAQTAPSETWAILVNEFGALGIDASLLQAPAPPPAPGQQPQGRVVVRELAGGCMCCSLSGPMGAAIAQLVRTSKPDRLIIEPSGLGHPAGLLDVLQGEHLRSALELRAVICLLDCRQARDPQLAASEVYQDQVNAADILVGTKADLATEDEALASELFPPKSRVLTVSHGALDPSLLDAPRLPSFQPWFPEAHTGARRRAQQQRQRGNTDQQQHSTTDVREAERPSLEAPPQLLLSVDDGTLDEAPAGGEDQAGGWQGQRAQDAWAEGRPARFVSEGSPTHLACGWMFPPDRVFDAPRLKQLLDAVAGVGGGQEATVGSGGAGGGAGASGGGVARVKGVFRVSKSSWVSVQLDTVTGGSGRAQLLPIAYRKDSRLEVILPRGRAGRGAVAAARGPEQAADGLGLQGVPVAAVAAGVDALAVSGSGRGGAAAAEVQSLGSQREDTAGSSTGRAGDMAGSGTAGSGGEPSVWNDAAVEAAVRALLRQEWHAFEACLCACVQAV